MQCTYRLEVKADYQIECSSNPKNVNSLFITPRPPANFRRLEAPEGWNPQVANGFSDNVAMGQPVQEDEFYMPVEPEMDVPMVRPSLAPEDNVPYDPEESIKSEPHK